MMRHAVVPLVLIIAGCAEPAIPDAPFAGPALATSTYPTTVPGEEGVEIHEVAAITPTFALTTLERLGQSGDTAVWDAVCDVGTDGVARQCTVKTRNSDFPTNDAIRAYVGTAHFYAIRQGLPVALKQHHFRVEISATAKKIHY